MNYNELKQKLDCVRDNPVNQNIVYTHVYHQNHTEICSFSDCSDNLIVRFDEDGHHCLGNGMSLLSEHDKHLFIQFLTQDPYEWFARMESSTQDLKSA